MGNYLTKVQDSVNVLLESTESQTNNRKRKRIPSTTEHDFAEVLRTTRTEQHSNEDEDDDAVSLSQLNTIMNRMNRPITPRNNNRARYAAPQICSTDLENLRFARDRLANISTTRKQTPKMIRTSTDHGQTSSQAPQKAIIDSKLQTPIRKKMKSTTHYLYTTLFINGVNSDLSVYALNKEWKLHKIYLCQSPYFETMFRDGSEWKESTKSMIEITIPDERINEKALFIAFGSFYKEDIEIVPLEVVSVLACASLFSLDGLILKCAEVMIENINFKSVIGYYEASLTYGVKHVTEVAVKWFCQNLMSEHNEFVPDLKLSLFEQILSYSDLLITRVEADLYSLLKKWLYFQLNKRKSLSHSVTNEMKWQKRSQEDEQKWQKGCNDFLKSFLDNKCNDSAINESDSSVLDLESTSAFAESNQSILTPLPNQQCLLDLPAFAKYGTLFRKLRLQHIIRDTRGISALYSDRIIPHSWVEQHYVRNWLNMIYIDQSLLSNDYEISKVDFDNNCARYGRVLEDDSVAVWRWIGFNYGSDLLISHTDRSLTLKRKSTLPSMHILSEDPPYRGILSQKQTQRIYYIMKVVKLDSFGVEKWSKETELKRIDLIKDGERLVLKIDPSVEYPILLNFRVAIHPHYNDDLVNNIFN